MKWGATNRSRPTVTLTDESPFPFGKHRGVPMEKVPADYFFWLEQQEWFSEWPAVVEYFESRRSSLEQDMKEAIRNRRNEVKRENDGERFFRDEMPYDIESDDVPW